MNDITSKINRFFDTKDLSGLFTEEEREKNRGIAALSYIPILWFVPFLAVRNSDYVRFHENQGLLVGGISIAVSLILGVFGIIPVVGIIFRVTRGIILTADFIFTMVGIANALCGKVKELPIIGGIRLFTMDREKLLRRVKEESMGGCRED